jgi:hypothetical protein
MPKKKSQVGKAKHVRDFENMDDAATLSQIQSDMRAAKAFQSPYFDKFRGYYKQYRSYISPENIKQDRSNLFIPYTFHQVETVTPKLILAMFKNRPYVQTVPLGVDNTTRELRSKKMNKLLDYQFQQRIKLVPLSTDIVKTTNIYGTAITKQTWDYREGKAVTRRPSVKTPGTYDLVLVNRTIADDPKVTLVPLLDFFFDPAGTTIDECRYNIHRYWEDLHELQHKNDLSGGMYRNLDKIHDTDDSSGAAAADKMAAELGYSTPINAQKGVEIWEYWTDDWVVKIANQSTVIYSGINPYFHMKKPFAKWVDTSVPNEFYGIGIAESIECLQAELNTTRNQRIDNVSLVLNKMWKIIRGANVDTTQLVSRPSGFIEVDEKDDVEELEFTDVTQSAYQEEAIIKGDMDRTTGIHDTERGSTPTRRETATTMNILSTAGNQRFELKTMLAEYGGCHDMINQIMWLDQQYIDRQRELILLGDDGTLDTDTISPEEIQGNWSIVAVGSSIEPAVNKEMRQTNLVNLYNMVQQRPDVDSAALLKMILEEFDIKNADRFFMQQQGTMPTGMLPQMAGGMPNGRP